MRELSVSAIREAVYQLFRTANTQIGEDVLMALEIAQGIETSPLGRQILSQLIENDRIAACRQMPICQDTGMAVVFLDIGQEVLLTGGALADAVDAGVREAYRDGCFRASVLTPLGRKNTGDNTPAVLHTRIVPGDKVEVWAAPKGFGSENMSRLWMLTPSQGRDGVLEAIVETVRAAGGNPCPPIVLGVCVGGTAEQAMLTAKRCLLRRLDEPSQDEEMAVLERDALAAINALGIGPAGFGGNTTALAVLAAQLPTHIAGLPVAVNVQCHAARHAHAVI